MHPRVRLLAAVLALAPAGCRRPLAPLPTLPDQLAPSTFAVAVHGRMGDPDPGATFEDRVTGTACRVGTTVLLDSRDRSRRISVSVPAFPDTPVAYPLRAWAPGFRRVVAGTQATAGDSLLAHGRAAEGHLNYGPSTRGRRPTGRGSLHMVDGTVTVAASDAGDMRGTLNAHLREGIYGDHVSPATAELAGVFRVGARDVCEGTPSPHSGLTGR